MYENEQHIEGNVFFNILCFKNYLKTKPEYFSSASKNLSQKTNYPITDFIHRHEAEAELWLLYTN